MMHGEGEGGGSGGGRLGARWRGIANLVLEKCRSINVDPCDVTLRREIPSTSLPHTPPPPFPKQTPACAPRGYLYIARSYVCTCPEWVHTTSQQPAESLYVESLTPLLPLVCGATSENVYRSGARIPLHYKVYTAMVIIKLPDNISNVSVCVCSGGW